MGFRLARERFHARLDRHSATSDVPTITPRMDCTGPNYKVIRRWALICHAHNLLRPSFQWINKQRGPPSFQSLPLGLRSQFLNFRNVSNIDHRLGTLRRMLVPSPHRPRHPSVTERPVALPPKHGESITCPNITLVPTHPCFLSNGLAAPNVRAA
jgi:hypothetical protein